MKQTTDVRFLPSGDCSLNVEFANEISPEINNKISALAFSLEKNPIKGVIENIPTYRSLLINYDPSVVSGGSLIKKIKKRLDSLTSTEENAKRIFVIPVCYEGEFAPDMANVCKHTGITADEVIKIHSGRDYLIYMLGFLPGFPYLGGLDERIHTPRLESPRTAIPIGSVGIGGKQTGIYPLSSPGGWQLIGRTPVKPYDPNRDEPIMYSAGDYIRFKPISAEEYRAIENDGNYVCEIIKE